MRTSKAMGPSTLQGSKGAKQALVAILEALSGEVSTSDVAERLTISLSRYYQLETRSLQGMLKALEPLPRGPKKTKDTEIRALRAEKRGLERELRQALSLLRAASRSVGVKPRRKRTASKKKGARRKHQARGKAVLETLREATTKEGSDGTQEPGGAAARTDPGE